MTNEAAFRAAKRGIKLMKIDSIFNALTMFAISFITVLLVSGSVFAHCDGLDGPVVKAAGEALETGNVNLVLIWVKKDDEGSDRQGV